MSDPLDTPLLDADDLLGMAAGGEAPSPLTGTAALLVDLAATSALDAEEAALAEAWLRAAGCPVIGVGQSSGALSAACDACVADTGVAAPLLEGIRAAPLAAATAMQLLRVTEGLPLEAALHAESLAYATLQSGPEYRAWLAAHQPGPIVVCDKGPAVLMEREDAHLQLRLNRASRRNAMSVEMRDALIEALSLVAADSGIATVTLDALGACFSTGGDLDEFGTAPDPVSGHLVRGLALPGRCLAACAERVAVRVHGACVGSGIEFPAFAGRIVAAPDSWFQLPELGFGLIPGAGGCVSIPRRIGRQRAAWMMLSRAPIKAATALDWGLVDSLE
ncbi:enoyl-CoA hydratase/isomerase family protein [Algiphilus aromaticivorans]|uniref:enoyl-CoA hydratase/isomerase family protein n=1 Tax=Algiphilus aromaticivorans TaxID=382454 RepID=UPI0005C25614|nr:enoyl-CoA hydratase/isomerase family protein [Algiphilus aromaticivorans]